MLVGVKSDCSKNFELILWSNAVTYMGKKEQYNTIIIVSLEIFSRNKN